MPNRHVHWQRIRENEARLYELGFRRVLESPQLIRLKEVSFLGTLDLLADIRRTFSRYEHSIGVAVLAADFALRAHLSKKEARILILGALLHDIGHAPLSHVVETFLLERMKRYHEGLGNEIVRGDAFTNGQPANKGSLVGLLKSLGSDIYEGACTLLSGCKMPIPGAGLFSGPTSFDSFDGITRTAWTLREQTIDPCSLTCAFDVRDGEVVVSATGLRDLQKFWNLQVYVYRRRIYTPDVLAAEAMVTRALEAALVGGTREQLARFARATDHEAWSIMKDTSIGNEMVRSLREGRLYKPLSATNKQCVDLIRSKIHSTGGRFAFKTRRDIESKIARICGVQPEQVITHYSFTREFRGMCARGHQTLDFHEPQQFSLSEMNRFFRGRRASGSRFDIFVPPEGTVKTGFLDSFF